MAKTKKSAKKPSVVSIRALCEKTDIKYSKVYNNLNGLYDSLDHAEKTKLANAFFNEASSFLKEIGFYIVIHRIKDPTQEEN